MKSIIYDKYNGCTEMSKDFVKNHLKDIVGKVQYVKCTFSKTKTWHELYVTGRTEKDHSKSAQSPYAPDYVETLIETDEYIFITDGYTWGYGGEGCSGLLWLIKKLNFPEISNYTENQLWNIILSAKSTEPIEFDFIKRDVIY